MHLIKYFLALYISLSNIVNRWILNIHTAYQASLIKMKIKFVYAIWLQVYQCSYINHIMTLSIRNIAWKGLTSIWLESYLPIHRSAMTFHTHDSSRTSVVLVFAKGLTCWHVIHWWCHSYEKRDCKYRQWCSISNS